MQNMSTPNTDNTITKKRFDVNNRKELVKSMKHYKGLYLMMIPGLILLFILHYLPMYGILLAFKEFNFSKGILGSKWVGFKYFSQAFNDQYFIRAVKNTLVISGLKLFVGFPIPVIFALLLNEIRSLKFKKLAQTISYFPYFVSWVVLTGIFIKIFSPEGPINYLRSLMGNPPVLYFSIPKWFLTIVVGTDIWRKLGWGAVIYLAALSNIDSQLYEAAYIDGAGRWKQTIHITIPSILPVVTIMLILNTGFILNAGFDQIFNMLNSMVLQVGEIIDTYVYKRGIVQLDYSYAAAIGMFKSLTGFILIYITNRIANVLGGKENSLW